MTMWYLPAMPDLPWLHVSASVSRAADPVASRLRRGIFRANSSVHRDYNGADLFARPGAFAPGSVFLGADRGLAVCSRGPGAASLLPAHAGAHAARSPVAGACGRLRCRAADVPAGAAGTGGL